MGALARRPRWFIAGAVVLVLAIVAAVWLPGYLERRELERKWDALLNLQLELCLEQAKTRAQSDPCLDAYDAGMREKDRVLDAR